MVYVAQCRLLLCYIYSVSNASCQVGCSGCQWQLVSVHPTPCPPSLWPHSNELHPVYTAMEIWLKTNSASRPWLNEHLHSRMLNLKMTNQLLLPSENTFERIWLPIATTTEFTWLLQPWFLGTSACPASQLPLSSPLLPLYVNHSPNNISTCVVCSVF